VSTRRVETSHLLGSRGRPVVRYAIYLHCSTDDQKEGDYTPIDTQRDITRRYVEERIAAAGGVGEFVGEYVDEGRTGRNLKRRDWRRLYTDAKARKFDTVVITYMSRLGRGEMYHIAEYLLSEEQVKV